MKNICAITTYAILYGLYEYNIVYYSLRLLQYLTKYGNWFIMWFLFFTICATLKMKRIDILYYLLWFSTIEDIIFWLCSWYRYSKYPYPVGNWYDEELPMFRLFHLGKAVGFEPQVPLFYYISLGICMVYFILNQCKYHKLIKYWNYIVLPPMYILIIGSLLLPKEIDPTNVFVIFATILSAYYTTILIMILYRYKQQYYGSIYPEFV